jgi:ring-1,2-phenylacetyl-CoA epoxidase subunit PaaE
MTEILELRIRELINETEDAVTFVFEEINSKKIDYKAGQFLTLLVDIHGKEIRRSYSFCSTPGIDLYPAVTIKRVVNGEVSRYLMDFFKVGDIIKALPPAGRFTLDELSDDERDIFLIGAGSGVTPLFSHLKNLLHNYTKCRITFICSNKNEGQIFYHQQLKALVSSYEKRFKLIHLLSEPGPEYKKQRGRLNIELLEKLVKQNIKYGSKEVQFMVCGPFSFMRMVRMTLIYMGYHDDQIKKENFVVKDLRTELPTVPVFPERRIKLLLKGKEIELMIPSGNTILEGALGNGIQLPYSCKAGVCSTCIGKCLSGKVHMIHNEVLTEKEVEEGLVLTCVAFPVTEGVLITI